jgi:hypothetical protein
VSLSIGEFKLLFRDLVLAIGTDAIVWQNEGDGCTEIISLRKRMASYQTKE